MKVIKLTQMEMAWVDDDDYERLISMGRWYTERAGKDPNDSRYFYARIQTATPVGRKKELMHRVIMGVIGDSTVVIDHMNHDTLDNRKCNLRKSTRAQNRQHSDRSRANTSSYIGVHRLGAYWHAQICLSGINKSLGMFDDKLEAAKAYDIAAKDAYGEFCSLNFPGIQHGTPQRAKPQIRSDNTSGARGVSQHLQSKKWRARVRIKKVEHYLGQFGTIEEAIKVREDFLHSIETPPVGEVLRIGNDI